MIEVGKQSKHFEYKACGWRAFAGRGGLSARKRGERLGDAGKRPRLAVISSKVDAPIVGDHLLHLLPAAFRKKFLEEIEQVTPDVAAQEFVADVVLVRSG